MKTNFLYLECKYASPIVSNLIYKNKTCGYLIFMDRMRV